MVQTTSTHHAVLMVVLLELKATAIGAHTEVVSKEKKQDTEFGQQLKHALIEVAMFYLPEKLVGMSLSMYRVVYHRSSHRSSHQPLE